MNVWHREKVKTPRRFALGLWIPQRKLASRAYVPTPRERQQLAGRRPFWEVFGEVAIAANQMSEQRVKLQSDFIAHTLMISTTGAKPGARVQVFDASNQPGRSKRLSIVGVNELNAGGSGQHPLLMRRPYRFYGGHTIIVRIQNLLSVTNKVQVVIHGVIDE